MPIARGHGPSSERHDQSFSWLYNRLFMAPASPVDCRSSLGRDERRLWEQSNIELVCHNLLAFHDCPLNIVLHPARKIRSCRRICSILHDTRQSFVVSWGIVILLPIYTHHGYDFLNIRNGCFCNSVPDLGFICLDKRFYGLIPVGLVSISSW